MSNWNLHDFLSKIDWEGGIYGALEYGLTVGDYDLPKEIADLWNELREQFDNFYADVAEFDALADKHAQEIPFEED